MRTWAFTMMCISYNSLYAMMLRIGGTFSHNIISLVRIQMFSFCTILLYLSLLSAISLRSFCC